MTKLSERFVSALEILGLKNADLTKKYDISRQNVNNFMSSQKTMTEKFAEICDGENININWLLTGNGKMFIIEPNENNTNLDGNNNTITTNLTNKSDHKDLIEFDYYPDIYASAGYGATNGDVVESQKVYMDKSFVNTILTINHAKNLDIIKVVGDSMEPFIQNGEQVVIQRYVEAKNNDVVIANINGSIYVKRLLKDPLGNWVKLISDNPSYPDIELKDAEIDYLNIIGILKAKIKLF